jgi:hypothetical protein
MGIVTEYVLQLIQHHIDENGIVVWFDPDNVYFPLIDEIVLSNSRIVRFNGSFLRLRRDVDDLLNNVNQEDPPRLLIYIPIARTQADHILDELIYGGTILQPGEPSSRNTSLDIIARQSLRMVFSREKLEDICSEIDRGRITSLQELDRLAEQGSANALTLIYNTNQPVEIAFQFLTNPQNDSALIEKFAIPTLIDLLTEQFGGQFSGNDEPNQLRSRLQRYLLNSEFCLRISGDIPAAFSTIQLPERRSQKDACLRLVENWRNRRDTQQNYFDTAQRVENELGIANLSLDEDALRNVFTFSKSDTQLLNTLAETLLIKPSHELVNLAQSRRSSFWAMIDEGKGTCWAVVCLAGQVILKSNEIQKFLKTKQPKNVKEYIELYTDANGWWVLDTMHRSMERYIVALDFTPDDQHSAIERLIARVRQDYSYTVDLLAHLFVPLVVDSHLNINDMLYQREIFSRYIAPSIGKKKIGYVLVDALRFEMACDLLTSLGKEWKSQFVYAIGTPPTITTVGMAALLPGAEHGITLVNSGGLAVEVNGHLLKDRKDRIALFSKNIDGFHEVKLEALLPAKKSTREAIAAAKFVLVTSQEIDLLGEGDSVIHAREFMDSALPKLMRAFRSLVDLGVQQIVVTADHGYLFSDELDTGATVPAPGGDTIKLERRVWIGRGGTSINGVINILTSVLGIGGDFEMATPIGLACFATSGGKSYFHGGLSLQELIIPLIVLEPVKMTHFAPIEWKFIPSREKITTRFFSVQIQGKVVGLFDADPPVVRVEIRSGGKSFSRAVSATYGFLDATGEINLRRRVESALEIEPNTIALMLVNEPSQKNVTISLIDAETEQVLSQFDIAVDISI